MSRVARYGSGPVDLGPLDLEWDEFMHYLYLPVRLPEREDPWADGDVILPPRLEFLRSAVYRVIENVDATTDGWLDDPYVYVTARRGYASPGNPLNRPGWHCDDFGGTDLNYIWSDAYPTVFLRTREGWPLDISDDDVQSMKDMAAYATEAQAWSSGGFSAVHPRVPWIEGGPVGHLLRLDPYVVHNTPIIPPPGGMRSFFKISVSSHRYNLRGNSHNHLLRYDWPMYDRDQLRNQPQGGNRDYYEEKAS
jgi:hypothetical protein